MAQPAPEPRPVISVLGKACVREYGEMIRIRKVIRGEKITAPLVSIFFLLFYVYYQTTSIYGGDAGDLVSAAFVGGVAHPPGYPLYTVIGFLLTKLPIFTVAWRVGLLSSIPGALSLGLFFLIVNKLIKRFYISLLVTLTFGFSYLFWLYAIVPEVFAVHLLLVPSLYYLLLRFRETLAP